jgi:hypothetical protein
MASGLRLVTEDELRVTETDEQALIKEGVDLLDRISRNCTATLPGHATGAIDSCRLLLELYVAPG